IGIRFKAIVALNHVSFAPLEDPKDHENKNNYGRQDVNHTDTSYTDLFIHDEQEVVNATPCGQRTALLNLLPQHVFQRQMVVTDDVARAKISKMDDGLLLKLN
ncbi:hypothetical protein Tco_0880324, partial [Tanacetum coccineum]